MQNIPTVGFEQVFPEDQDLKTKLNQIRKGCGVWIDRPEGQGEDNRVRYVRIIADNKDKLDNAIERFRAVVLVREDLTVNTGPVYLVQPMSHPLNKSIVTLEPQSNGRYRPVVTASTEPMPISSTRELERQTAVFTDAFRARFAEVAARMCQIPEELRMRVHLGTFELPEWKKGQMIYDGSQFTHLLQSVARRGTACLKQR